MDTVLVYHSRTSSGNRMTASRPHTDLYTDTGCGDSKKSASSNKLNPKKQYYRAPREPHKLLRSAVGGPVSPSRSFEKQYLLHRGMHLQWYLHRNNGLLGYRGYPPRHVCHQDTVVHYPPPGLSVAMRARVISRAPITE